MQARLIPLASGLGSWNMAVDQALLESVDQTQIPMLRLYSWSAPTLSLGYFQKLSDRDHHVASRTADCVRRSTGGGAILHHHELTYSIAMPIAASHSGARMDLYHGMHEVIRKALSNWSIQANRFCDDMRHAGDERSLLCFQRRSGEDLIVSGYKVLGSAQRRSRNAVLQHGSLLLRASEMAPELPGVIDLGATVPSSNDASTMELAKEIAQCIVGGSTLKWSMNFVEDSLSVDELANARQIESSRFAAAAWLARR